MQKNEIIQECPRARLLWFSPYFYSRCY